MELANCQIDWTLYIRYFTVRWQKKKCISIVEQFFSILQKNHQRFIREYVPSIKRHKVKPYVSESRLNINNWISTERTVLIRVQILIWKEKKKYFTSDSNLPRASNLLKQTNKHTWNRDRETIKTTDTHPPRKGPTQHFQPFRIVRNDVTGRSNERTNVLRRVIDGKRAYTSG